MVRRIIVVIPLVLGVALGLKPHSKNLVSALESSRPNFDDMPNYGYLDIIPKNTENAVKPRLMKMKTIRFSLHLAQESAAHLTR